MTFSFFVAGRPRTKGKHIAICPRARDHARGHSTPCRPIVVEDYRSDQGKNLKEWESAVRVASRAVAPPVPLEGPCCSVLVFRFARPACRSKEPYPTASPGDVEKLVRAVHDGLQAKTGGYLVADDNQFTELHARVLWADGRGPGVEIEISAVGAEQQTLFGSRIKEGNRGR